MSAVYLWDFVDLFYSVCFVATGHADANIFSNTSKVVELCSKEIANKLRVIDKAESGRSLGNLQFLRCRSFQVASTPWPW